jgi:hypothetical protein
MGGSNAGCGGSCAGRVVHCVCRAHFAFRISHFAFRICRRFTLRAREPHASARVGGGSVPPAHPARLISAWTAEIRGRSIEVRPRNFDGPRSTLRPLADMPSTRAVSLRPNPPPTLSQAPAWQGDKYQIPLRVFGEGFGIVGPSRPRRCPRPAASPCRHPSRGLRVGAPTLLCVSDEAVRLRRHAGARASRARPRRLRRRAPLAPQATTARRSCNGRWHLGRHSAFKASARVDAPRGHRRGLDGPTMPKTSLKTTERYLSPCRAGACDRVGGGLGRWLTARAEGMPARGNGVRFGRRSCADELRPNALGFRPSRPKSDEPGEPEEQTPRLPCRSHAAGVREARGVKRLHMRSAKCEVRSATRHRWPPRSFFKRPSLSSLAHRIPGNRR